MTHYDRSAPLFQCDEPLSRGVQLGILMDYAIGDSSLTEDGQNFQDGAGSWFCKPDGVNALWNFIGRREMRFLKRWHDASVFS